MQLNLKDFRRKCQFPVMLACGTLPLFILLVNGFSGQEKVPFVLPYTALYLLIGEICMLVKGKWRIPVGILGAAAMVWAGLKLFYTDPYTMLILLCYLALLIVTLPMGGWKREQEPHPVLFAIGVICHVAGQVAVNIFNRTGLHPAIGAQATVILLAFIVFAVLVLLSFNRNTMDSASMGRQRIPTLMRHRNTIFTIGLLAVVLLLSAIPALVRAIETAWNWLVGTILAIIAWIAQFMPQGSSGGGGGGPADMMGFGGEIPEPSLFAVITEKIMMVITLLALVVLIFFLLRTLYKKLKVLLKKLWARLGQYAAMSSEDYDDEITDTREEGERERIDILTQMRQRLIRVDEKKLSPVERIRYRYLRLRLKHQWQPSATARDTLPEDSARLYERARYSQHPVTEEEAEAFAKNTKSI